MTGRNGLHQSPEGRGGLRNRTAGVVWDGSDSSKLTHDNQQRTWGALSARR